MITTRVMIVGDDALRFAFRQMTVDAAGPLLDVAVRAGAELIRADAARRAPVKTGTLRRSIHTKRTGT